MDGREATSTSGENPGGIFERVPEKLSGTRIKLPITNKKEPILQYHPRKIRKEP
jgi:hypothetical protein